MHPARQRTRLARAGKPAAVWAVVLICLLGQPASAKAEPDKHEQLIPILGVTMDPEPNGTVVYLVVSVEKRLDHSGLVVFFRNSPGRFSRMAQMSIKQGIIRAADSMGLSHDSWTVELMVPYRKLTVYGESLSAMVSLSVMAMANGEPIAPDSVMTGTVTADGHIGPVGSVPQKILAAEAAHIRRVLVPDKQDPADSDWQTPFLMQVSPVGSVDQAYDALTQPQPVSHLMADRGARQQK